MGSIKSIWNNLNVSTKMAIVIGILVALIFSQMVAFFFSAYVFTSVRSFVTGEGHWSKAQKNALIELNAYVVTNNDENYRNFKNHLITYKSDLKARELLQKRKFDYNEVYRAFIDGGNHPADVPYLVSFVDNFYKVSFLQEALKYWKLGDAKMQELEAVAEELHKFVLHLNKKDQANHNAALVAYSNNISLLNQELTVLENNFSNTISEAARWIENKTLIVFSILVFCVGSIAIFLAYRLNFLLVNNLRKISVAAEKIGQGDFNQVVQIPSNDEIGQLATSINQMSENLKNISGERLQAEEASQLKNLFLANISHELRTPLGAMLGFVELVRDPSIKTEEKEKYLDLIQSTGQSLVTIINDVLDVSKVEAGKIEISKEVFSLRKLLKDTEAILRLRSDAKGLYLSFEEIGKGLDLIKTDPMRLRQILVNLVGNAIKFTEKGGIKVKYEIQTSEIMFWIEDTGPGISEEFREYLFKPFSQAETNVRRFHGGTGLGLNLSRKLARLLGGDIQLQSSLLGVGSTFLLKIRYEIPVEELKVAQPISIQAYKNSDISATSLSGKHYLIVEDSKENQFLFSNFLSKAGATYDLAENGRVGLELYATKSYNGILMDMQMPVMDGYEATKKLRELGCNLPIIALTAHAMKSDIEQCYKIGCDYVITKPVTRADLVKALMRYF